MVIRLLFLPILQYCFHISVFLLLTGRLCCRIEVAVKQILSGMQVKTNASVANPEALDWFRAWAEKH